MKEARESLQGVRGQFREQQDAYREHQESPRARLEADVNQGFEEAQRDGLTPEQIDRDPSLLYPYLEGDALEFMRAVVGGREHLDQDRRGEVTANDRLTHWQTTAQLMERYDAGPEAALKADDPRLQPIGGMSFDVYVQLAAETQVVEPAPDVEERGQELGAPAGGVREAFDAWGDHVMGDQELFSHYWARMQAEMERLRPS